MKNRVFAIRGATTVKEDMPEQVIEASCELMSELLEKNDLADFEIVSILISTTQDIRSYYPAKAIREKLDVCAPLFSCAEPDIYGALKFCIRILLTIETDKKNFAAKHVYLNGAKVLRPDLAGR